MLAQAARATKRVGDRLAEYQSALEAVAAVPTAPEYIRDEFGLFLRHRGIAAVLEEFAGRLDSTPQHELIDALIERMNEAAAINLDAKDPELVVDAAEQAIAESEENDDRVPFGVSAVDPLIGGGLTPGQVGLILAASGRGKSICLASIARAAAEQDITTLYISLELRRKMQLTRFAHAITGKSADETADDDWTSAWETHHWRRWQARKLPLYHQEEKVGLTVPRMKANITSWTRRTGIKPQLVIIDYFDLMGAVGKFDNSYYEQKAVGCALMEYAQREGVVIWSASQVQRAAYKAEVVEDSDAGQSIAKIDYADVVATISMSAEERRERRARINIAKNRNGPSPREVPLVTDYSRFRLVDVEAMQSVLARQAMLDEADRQAQELRANMQAPTNLPVRRRRPRAPQQ